MQVGVEVSGDSVWGALEVLASSRPDFDGDGRDELLERFDQLLARMMAFRAEDPHEAERFVSSASRELAALSAQVGSAESPLSRALARALSMLRPARGDGEVHTEVCAPASFGSASEGVADSAPERRDAERRVIEVDVDLVSESNFYTGFSEDLSEGGLFVATYQQLSIGTVLKVSFVLPGGRHVVADGDVRWIRAQQPDMMPGIGVAFAALSAADHRAIEQFMKRRPPLFYDHDD